MDLPALQHWFSISALFALMTGVIGAVFSIVGLPENVPPWVRWPLSVMVGVLALVAALNAAVQDRDSGIVTAAAKDQGPRLARIESKLVRLAIGLNVPEGDHLEDRVDQALTVVAQRTRNNITEAVNESKAKVSGSTSAPPQDKVGTVDQTPYRSSLLRQLTQLYVLSHDGISSEMMAGLEAPPVGWLNAELEKRSADWRVVSCNGANCETKQL